MKSRILFIIMAFVLIIGLLIKGLIYETARD